MERAEYVLSGALVAAVQSRNVPALQEAIAAAEAVKDPTMQKDICGGLEEVLLNSPPMLQAKHMLELLQLERDLKVGLAETEAKGLALQRQDDPEAGLVQRIDYHKPNDHTNR